MYLKSVLLSKTSTETVIKESKPQRIYSLVPVYVHTFIRSPHYVLLLESLSIEREVTPADVGTKQHCPLANIGVSYITSFFTATRDFPRFITGGLGICQNRPIVIVHCAQVRAWRA